MFRTNFPAAALVLGTTLLSSLPVAAETCRWAGTTDPQTMDPHAVNAAPVLSFLNNVYEGLVRRGPDMSVEPSLATSWEALPEGAGWRFTLRAARRRHVS